MISITQLEYLVAVSEELHFGHAAKRCYVSQPSLSLQVQKLEDELGVLVFHRTKRHVSKTEEGEKIIQTSKGYS